ncbi:uncharacterized protein LOC121297506 [Polyodon spathula]|uniref:uncharacterized protein LOC121297506 n=1 Tax=Polyodon spathula TaxID=7913 RepID=UPI001B7DE08F|nr:uncharacterized protein LOC121297506 [Polyodon spathula]
MGFEELYDIEEEEVEVVVDEQPGLPVFSPKTRMVSFDSAEPGMLGFKYFLDAIYILNIISRFYIGFESQGVVIMDKKQLQKRYLQGWFTVDLFAIFPFEFVILTYPEKDIWVLLSYCRLNRIVKVVRLFSFIFFIMFTALGVLVGVIMTGMSSIITNLDARRGRFYHRLYSIKLNMKDIDLPPEVQTWVEKYYVYLWKHRKGTIIAGLLDDLPFSIHSEISLACNQMLLKKSTLFRGTDEGFKRALSVSINPYTYSAGQILAKRGESNQSMYYLEHGLVQAIEDNAEKIATVLPGSLIGEIYLMYKIPRNVTICAATLCEIYVLHQKDLLNLFADFPDAGVKIAQTARNRLQNIAIPIKDAFDVGAASNPQNVPFWMKTLRPDSKYIQFWEVFLLCSLTVAVFLEVWVVLFTFNEDSLGFNNSGFGASLHAVAYIIDLVAVVDIVINLRTQVVSKNGNQSDFKSIYKNYQRTWNLYYDVAAVLPTDMFTYAEEEHLRWSYLGLFRINRLVWLRKVYLFYVKRENDLEKNLLRYRALKCVFMLTFSIHTCAGLFYLAGCFKHKVGFQNRLVAMTYFMESHDLSQSLQQRVIQYMSLLWEKYHGQAYPGGPFLMYDLPTELQQIVLLKERGKLLSKLPFFYNTGSLFIRELATTSIMYFYPKGEIIQYSETISQELFCIRRGCCQILSDDLNYVYGVYTEGMYFGEAGFLFGKPATMTLRAKTYCEVLVINFDRSHKVFDKYPAIRRTLRGKLSLFFFMTLPEVFLMTSAILPSNRLYIRWEIFRIFLALTVSIFTSTLISFLHFKRELWFTCYILGGFCWLDMYVRLHVAFYKDNKLKVDTLETARHYVRTSFLLDLVSCFPFEVFAWTVVSPFDESGNFYTNYKAMHLYAYLRVPHILQLYRIPLAYNYWQMAIATEKLVVTFLQFFLYMILFIHFSTCLIYAVPCGPVLNINIIENDTNNIFKHLCDNKSWVMQLRETFGTDHCKYSSCYILSLSTKLSFKEIYTISMYFSTTTIFNVGYGDLCSHTFKMDIALFTLMVLGSLYFGWMVGTVTSILANADAARAVYTEKLDSIKHFLKSQKITGTIADSVQKFYSFKWIKTKGVDPETLFEYLPSSLLGDISTIIYSDVIAKAFGLNIKTKKTKECSSHVLTPLERRLSGKLDGPIFEKTLSKESLEKLETDGGFIRMLATKIRPCVFRANDIICKRNDYGSEMFFIEKGEVDVLSQDERSVMVTLKAGQYFGEGSLLFSEPRSTSIRASTNCDMYVLDKKDLDSTVKYYPDICQEIRDSAIAKREHLLKLKAHQLQISKMETVKNGDKFDAGNISFQFHFLCLVNQMYLKYMAEQELKSKYVALPLIVRMRTAFCKFYNDSLKKIIQLHNMTIDPEKTLRIILQYTSCLFVIISFWTITYMIFLKFHICYCDANGTYICDYQSVSKYYLKRKAGFVFDMFCSFPFALIVLLQNDSSVNLFDYHMSHIRLFHCLRLFNVFFFIREEEERITTNKTYQKCNVFRILLLLKHYCFTGHTDELASVYIYAIYWATATFTTTGYGDIRAVTYPEIWFCILVMLLSKTLVGYNIGIISSTQTNKNSLQVSYEEKLQVISQSSWNIFTTKILNSYYLKYTHTNMQRVSELCPRLIEMFPCSISDY